MHSFGRDLPRSKESLGVSGLLRSGCHILYENIFSTHHVGKITDLVLAKMREFNPEELGVRASFIYSVFLANLHQNLSFPVVIECGYDDEKIAIGITFTQNKDMPIDWAQLESRITSLKASTPFEFLLSHLYAHANWLVVKHQASSNRIEVVSLVGVPGKMTAQKLNEPHVIEVVQVPETPPQVPPSASYTLLGDLDYFRLLKEDARELLGSSPTGEFLARAIADAQVIQKVVVGGAEKSDTTSEAVKGQAQEAEASKKIDGDGKDLVDQTAIEVKGNPLEVKQAQQYLEKIAELQKKIEALEAERAEYKRDSLSPHSHATAAHEEGKQESSPIESIFKKIWPFSDSNKKHEDQSDAHLGPSLGTAQANSEQTSQQHAEDKDAPAVTVPSPIDPNEVPHPEIVAQAEKLFHEFDAGPFDKVVKKFQRDAYEVKVDLPVNSKAQRWIEDSMAELAREKERLHALANQVADALRKKELDLRQKEIAYKNNERAMQNELENRDRALRHKDIALNRTKDMLSQTNMALERLKSQNQAATSLGKKSGPTSLEMSLLKDKLEKALKDASDLKKANTILEQKAAQPQPNAIDPVTHEDLKSRLDSSMKMLSMSKKQADRLTAQVEQFKKDEARTKGELARIQTEVKMLRARIAAKEGGDSSSGDGDSNAA